MDFDVDQGLMAEAHALSGLATPKDTLEEALRTLIRLRRQGDALDQAFGRYQWQGDLEESRRSRFGL